MSDISSHFVSFRVVPELDSSEDLLLYRYIMILCTYILCIYGIYYAYRGDKKMLLKFVNLPRHPLPIELSIARFSLNEKKVHSPHPDMYIYDIFIYIYYVITIYVYYVITVRRIQFQMTISPWIIISYWYASSYQIPFYLKLNQNLVVWVRAP